MSIPLLFSQRLDASHAEFLYTRFVRPCLKILDFIFNPFNPVFQFRDLVVDFFGRSGLLSQNGAYRRARQTNRRSSKTCDKQPPIFWVFSLLSKS